MWALDIQGSSVAVILPIVYGGLFLVFLVSAFTSYFVSLQEGGDETEEEGNASSSRSPLGDISRASPIQPYSPLEDISHFGSHGDVSLWRERHYLRDRSDVP